MDKVELHREIVYGMNEMYEKKNKDYGDSFDKSLDEFGMTSSAIRLTDKMNRFKQLINNDANVNDESIEDTLLDMANYAIMTVMWMKLNEKEREHNLSKFIYREPSWSTEFPFGKFYYEEN